MVTDTENEDLRVTNFNEGGHLALGERVKEEKREMKERG